MCLQKMEAKIVAHLKARESNESCYSQIERHAIHSAVGRRFITVLPINVNMWIQGKFMKRFSMISRPGVEF